MTTISLLSGEASRIAFVAPVRHTAYFLPPTIMLDTFTCTLPDNNPVGILDEIPPEAWDEAIATARAHGVQLTVTRHARPDEVPHHHFNMTGGEDLEAQVPLISRLIAKVLNAHTKTVTLPEGR